MLEPIIITPAVLPAVFLHEFKAHARITHDDEDSTLDAFIAAATRHFQWRTGRTVMETEYEYALEAFPDCVHLPYGFPLISITHIKYTDSTGTVNTWGAANYVSDEWGRVTPAYGITWPSFTARPLSPIRIRYKAGIALTSPQLYAEDGIRQTILEMAGALYLNREHVSVTDRQSVAAYAENPVTRTMLELYKVNHAF
jgi:uncharacterized phiE125 gp8 family phage protein